MNALKARVLLTAVVCAGAFYISAGHIISVAEKAGNSLATAVVYPVSIDALIVISTLTLVAKTGVNRMAKWYAALGRGFGFAATIYCNMAASNFASANDMVVNLLPAISLIITVEMLIHAAKATPAARVRKAPAKRAPRPARVAKHAPAAPAKLKAV